MQADLTTCSLVSFIYESIRERNFFGTIFYEAIRGRENFTFGTNLANQTPSRL